VEYFYRVFSKKLKWISLTKGMTSTNQTNASNRKHGYFSEITNIVEYIKAQAIDDKMMILPITEIDGVTCDAQFDAYVRKYV
jgi:hypothetical protein